MLSSLFSVKRAAFIIAAACALTAPTTMAADYITENLSTYMRKGAGDQFKISGTIQAGEKVTVLERKDRYVHIRDSKNRTGWVLANEVTQTASPKDLIPELRQQVQELTQKLNKIDSDWQQRTIEMQRRTQQSEMQSNELIELNAQLKRELEILKNKNRDLETMHDSEKREIYIQWFIYGGSVLGVGLILGLIIPLILPRRRRNNGWA